MPFVYFMALGLMASPALSQDTPPKPDQPIIVKADPADQSKKSTAAKTIIGRAELQKFGDSHLGDALTRLPGLSLNAKGVISLRGLSGYTQILLNGEKVPDGFDLMSLSPDMIERVEIIKSPMADLSTQAIGGTINIILRKTVSSNQSQFKLNLGEADGLAQDHANLNWSHHYDRLSFSLDTDINYRGFDNHNGDHITGSDPMGTPDLIRNTTLFGQGFDDHIGLTPNLSYSDDQGQTWSLLTLMDARRISQLTQNLSNTLLGTSDTYASNPQHFQTDILTLRSDLERKYNFANGADIDAKLSFKSFDKRGRFHQLGYDNQGNLNLDDWVFSSAHERGLSSMGKLDLPLWGAQHLALGWQASTNSRLEDRYQNDAPIGNLYLSGYDLNFKSRIEQYAAFAQMENSLTPLISLYYGLRFEAIDTQTSGNDFAPIHNHLAMASPVLQSLIKLSEASKDQIRLALNRTFSAPTISSLIPRPYTSTNNSAFMPDQIGNPALRPETALGLDISYEHYWAKSGLISFGGFMRDISDKIQFQTQLINGRYINRPLNIGRATSQGLEAEAKLRTDDLNPDLIPIDLHLSFTENRSRLQSLNGPNNSLADQSPLSATFSVDYKSSHHWAMGSSLTYSQSHTIRASAFEMDSETGKTTWDSYGLWEISKRTRLRLTLRNILHQDYRGITQFIDSTGTRTDWAHNLSPMALSLGLELSL